MSRITVVGCGMMGGNISDAFLECGHEVTIVDVDPATALSRVERGAQYSETLADALDVKFVLFSLPTNEVVRTVLSQCPEGALRGKIIVNTTSEVPSEVLSLERDVCALGGRYIDAKILTYQGEVGRCDACLLYSGDRAAFDEIGEELRALSPEPLFLGNGVSAAAEIVDIVVVAGHYGLTYSPLEGIACCAEYGIDVDEYMGLLGDLLVELSEHALPGGNLFPALHDEGFGELTGLIKDCGAYDHLSPAWLSEINRGVAAHLRKVIGIAMSDFNF